jgi:hypothetical protein
VDAFREAAVDGDMLVRLTAEDMAELGLSSLQSKRLQRAVEFSTNLATAESDSSTRIRELEAEIAALRAQLAEYNTNAKNTCDEVRRRQNAGSCGGTPPNRVSLIGEDGLVRSGLSAHLTPTKRRKLDSDGNPTNHHWQGKCNVCKKKSTQMCSVCGDNGKTVYICGTRKGQVCFAEHMQHTHDHESTSVDN